jgi:hypothetical protein
MSEVLLRLWPTSILSRFVAIEPTSGLRGDDVGEPMHLCGRGFAFTGNRVYGGNGLAQPVTRRGQWVRSRILSGDGEQQVQRGQGSGSSADRPMMPRAASIPRP